MPGFREAHLEVCKVYREIDRSRWHRLKQLREAAYTGDKEAQEVLTRYDDAMDQRRWMTKGGA